MWLPGLVAKSQTLTHLALDHTRFCQPGTVSLEPAFNETNERHTVEVRHEPIVASSSEEACESREQRGAPAVQTRRYLGPKWGIAPSSSIVTRQPPPRKLERPREDPGR
jgi:hypothetical protein